MLCALLGVRSFFPSSCCCGHLVDEYVICAWFFAPSSANITHEEINKEIEREKYLDWMMCDLDNKAKDTKKRR